MDITRRTILTAGAATATVAIFPRPHVARAALPLTQPKLPFAEADLAPVISARTVGLHYGKHHKAYFDKLNTLAVGTRYADMELEENTRAASELEQAVRLDPTDTWSWESLGLIYGGTGQWDKAWDVADQLIRMEPDAPDGWQLRAQVQMEQPRAGLADTEQAFAERFGNRPDQQATLNHMRNALAHLKH